ncbi:hypothetical protein BRCON_2247 [Candidatus Sumerlaea chitinivorans]|uniref:GIY-YIG domain-containing protein n=1 Tax=Sumerlaea chitinivorans TaxID=2250252 RepID=A0A2Z4Y727_SUMC1|nr:hypothetical protein BRCON_2247 [Candidatus Sumerlaea chitinivorans]
MRQPKDRGQKIIANMGLYWDRERVFWGKQARGAKGELLGRRASGKRKGTVNFWDQVGIYALYENYKLVYVGQAGLSDKSCIGKRLRQHLNDDLAGRWNKFSWFGLFPVGPDNKLVVARDPHAPSEGSACGPDAATSKSEILMNSKLSHLADVLEGVIIEVAEPPMNAQKGRFGPNVERYDQADREEAPAKNSESLKQKLQLAIQSLSDCLQALEKTGRKRESRPK